MTNLHNKNGSHAYAQHKVNPGKKRVVWLPLWPNKNIYAPIFNKLGEMQKDLDLIMVVPQEAKTYDAGDKNFTLRYLPQKEYKKLFFLDYLKKKKKNEEIDVTTTMKLVGLSSELKGLRPDIVISNMEYSLFTVQAAMFCRKHKVPLIVQSETKIISGMRRRLYLMYMRLFFQFFRKNIPALTGWTDASTAFMSKNFAGMTKAKVYSLPPGIDTKKFYYSKKHSSKKLRMLVVSRLAPYKRHEDILKAAAYLKEKHDIEFEIGLLGSGPMKDRIAAQISELKLEKLVRFLPPVKFDNMRRLYSDYDVLVLASFNEAIGMVVPEAMACGTPVIVSDTCGAVTYVRDGKSGYVFKTFDYKDMASKILLMENNEKRKKMGKYASLDIHRNYSVDVIASRFDKIIRETMNRKS